MHIDNIIKQFVDKTCLQLVLSSKDLEELKFFIASYAMDCCMDFEIQKETDEILRKYMKLNPEFENKPGIYGFFNEYRYLSNFHVCDVEFEGMLFSSSEHAYQAAKTEDLNIRKKILELPTPKEAKRFGKIISLRDNWDNIKYDIMYKICFDKFSRNNDIKKKLIETDGMFLEETNPWGDCYWGVCNGIGDNNLGKILMQIRNELINIT